MEKRRSAILLPLLVTLVCFQAVEGISQGAQGALYPQSNSILVTQPVPDQEQITADTDKSTDTEDARIIPEGDLFRMSSSASGDLYTEKEFPADAQTVSLSLVLMGTIVSEGENSRAIILEKDKKTQRMYQQGEVVQGAVLKKILRGRVVLTYNNKDEVLDMTEAKNYSAEIPPDPQQPTPEFPQAMPESTPSHDQLKTIRPARRTYVPVQEHATQQ